jgi:GxxExxY protein
MPITCSFTARTITQEEFASLDYRLMRHAFDAQNDLGRLCDEVIYRHDLAARLETARFGPVRTEVPVAVSHAAFSKTYRLDLVVGDAAVYELKTEVALARDHDAQLLNYLFLCGTPHGKLLNFRPAHVESRFVNAVLTSEERRRFSLDTTRWRESDEASRNLRMILLDLLEDWGGFLDVALYVEAVTHFLGGEQKVMALVPLRREGFLLGNQRMHLLGPEVGFRITALPDNAEEYEPHLRGLLAHSPLRAVQWVNLARHVVQFVTVEV